jgi:hypothetical protein
MKGLCFVFQAARYSSMAETRASELELAAPIAQPIGQDFRHPRFGFGKSLFLVIPIPEQLSRPVFKESYFGGEHAD